MSATPLPTPEPKKKEERAPDASGVVPPSSEASPAPLGADSERKARVAPAPVELPRMPSRELEVTSNLELMRWRQSEAAKAGADSEPVSPWERRAIEVDFSSDDASATQAASSGAQEEIPLASVHEFIPTWDPSADSAASSTEPAESAGDSQGVQLVQLEEALEALRQATTRGALGKVLLSYCQGRFPRGFLLGETFGFARVGRGYGPGSNKSAVTALQVDLDAPSLLAMAAAGGRLVVSSMPESQEDEALFAALGESFSHLAAAPIRASERTVGFVVLDGGPSPFGAEELDDLEKLITAASEAYGRLSGSSF